MIKKAAILFSIIVALVSSDILYPMTMEVVEVDEEKNMITLETAGGDLFTIQSDVYFEVGDFASTIMYDNGTQEIEDDMILSARYSGYHVYG